MSAKTFTEWQAYCSLEPFGPPAEFWRAGLIASTFANANRKKGQDSLKPEDFMPKSMQAEPIEGEASTRAEILKQNFENYQQAQKVTGQ